MLMEKEKIIPTINSATIFRDRVICERLWGQLGGSKCSKRDLLWIPFVFRATNEHSAMASPQFDNLIL